MKRIIALLSVFITLSAFAAEREYIWPKGKMPDLQEHQIAAMTDVSRVDGFKPDKYRKPYLDWCEAPAADVDNHCCMILISGGGYYSCCDVEKVETWRQRLTELGFHCVNFVYRTPRPEGLPIYQSAWEDGQRAVRMVRSEAEKRGFDPEKIGTISMSAGSHLALLLGTSSQTPAYEAVDELDSLPCHINWAIVNAPAYVLSDGDMGEPNFMEGYDGNYIKLNSAFKFDEKTCPMSLHHGGLDPYSPIGSTMVYRKLRSMGIPAEVHLYPDLGHCAPGLERAVEFMRQMGFMGELEEPVDIMTRYDSDENRAEYIVEKVWPGRVPNFQEHQCVPLIEWHIPVHKTTDAIQIIYSGGGYGGNSTKGFEVEPAVRYLNEKGMTVVTLTYRTPRPNGLPKHVTAWQDLQRAIRIVRSEAAERGLDPNRIGIMGSSAGGHLTLMGVTSSLHNSYLAMDDIDKESCSVQWGIGIYPAYALTDGIDVPNTTGGNDDSAVLVPEYSFDLATAPMLFIHGDADGWAAMNSVKTWEKMRAMGIQSEVHTLALRPHCFQASANPGTGSYTWLDRIWEFLTAKGFNK